MYDSSDPSGSVEAGGLLPVEVSKERRSRAIALNTRDLLEKHVNLEVVDCAAVTSAADDYPAGIPPAANTVILCPLKTVRSCPRVHCGIYKT